MSHRLSRSLLGAGLLLLAGAPAGMLPAAPALAQPAVPVTVHSFNRAETDNYLATFVGRGALGRFQHDRQVVPVESQPVIRMNRDTLYSSAVVDLDAGPATVTLPDAGGRFMSLLAVDQDHFAYGVFYAPAQFVFTRDQVGTRYLALFIRTFIDPDSPADLAAAHALQDRVTLSQASPGKLELPAWDRASLEAVRAALNALAVRGFDPSRGLGRRGELDPVDHLLATASGWGGNPPAAATYQFIAPPPGETAPAWRMRFGEVPVDGFWSLTMYNAQGFMQPNPRNAYSVNNVTAQRAADGSVTVQFGNCGETTPNCLPTPEGWNLALRLYRPRAEILDGRWQRPPLEPMR